MTHLVRAVALGSILATSPCAAWAQPSLSSINVGPHGNDWILGAWTCHNPVPSQLGGPSTIRVRAYRSNSSAPDIFLRFSGRSFDASAYLHYDAKTQIWWNPSSVASGVTANESSRQTGKTAVWNGTTSDASGTSKVRDTYVHMDMRRFTDTTEVESGGVWKTAARLLCTKS